MQERFGSRCFGVRDLPRIGPLDDARATLGQRAAA
jgi:hypothetical protein